MHKQAYPATTLDFSHSYYSIHPNVSFPNRIIMVDVVNAFGYESENNIYVLRNRKIRKYCSEIHYNVYFEVVQLK